MTKTVEDLSAEMEGIVNAAEGRSLTDDEVTAYEALEGDLKAAQRTDAIRARQEAYSSIAPFGPVAPAKQDNGLELAFTSYLRTGRPNADLTELRNAQGESAGSEGGYTVPEVFRQKLVDRKLAFGGIASVAETIVTETGAPMNWTTVDDTSNVGEIVAEGGTFTSGADLVFGTATLGAYKYASSGASTAPLRVSVELLQDSAFDVQGFVARKLGERIGRIQATHLVTGTGVGQPQGIQTGLTGTQTATSTLTYADLVGMVHSVDPAYREGATWAFNDTMLKTIRKLLDTNARPILKRGDESAETGLGGDSLLGYPVVIDQAFSTMTNNTTTNWGVFGQLSEGFVIRRVRDITLVVNPWTRAAYGQVEFSAWARMDAVQQNTNAYKALTGHA